MNAPLIALVVACAIFAGSALALATTSIRRILTSFSCRAETQKLRQQGNSVALMGLANALFVLAVFAGLAIAHEMNKGPMPHSALILMLDAGYAIVALMITVTASVVIHGKYKRALEWETNAEAFIQKE